MTIQMREGDVPTSNFFLLRHYLLARRTAPEIPSFLGVQNGGFESDLSNWNTPVEPFFGPAAVRTVTPHSGAKHVELICETPANIQEDIETDVISVEPGKDYDLEFWFRTNQGKSWFYFIAEHYRNGIAGARTNVLTVESLSMSLNTWTKYNVTIQPQTATDRIYFAARNRGDASIWSGHLRIDDVVLTEL